MRWLAIAGVACIALAFALGGAAPFGRAALAIGLYPLAANLFSDPNWHGIALYRSGDFDKAAEAFKSAGNNYNLGNAEARNGKLAAALEAYDQAIGKGNPDAQANFDVLAAFYAGQQIEPEALGLFPERKSGPKAESFVARGNARAAGTGSEVTNSNTMLGLAELDSRGRLGVRRIFDDKFMVADQRWLNQLSDVPGEFMAARIAQEHKRRVKLGLSPPEAESPE
ncbi:tetratricopeptide repeat protein [uncultured Ruegeria sp.]|uniref:tetratricopeptide repeat protein n=1 Tax=uncultured Ruegeria sp. TaxID=259304 RepID=UPI0026105DC5|nr:tetratricopeptide repeat protein [uncultured Ruegeria sp.]